MAASDERLAERAREGSEQAFGELVRRYERPICSLIGRMVWDRGQAEDLAQEAFVRAWSKLHTYDPERPFRSWMFKIAHNLTLDALRRAQLDTVSLETPDSESLDPLGRLEDEGVSPEEQVHHRRAVQALERAVGELRADHREVLLLRFREGLSYEEIAEALELPLGTVKTHLHRARKHLVALMEAAGYTKEWT
ncbi:MAG: RNA polymerase sigma factor [Thermoanaerobaculia bacterium]